MSGIFKAYDIRGIYPSEINEEIVAQIVRAFVTLEKPKTIVIGRDMRDSSPKLFAAAVEAVTSLGVNVIDVGMVSTPMFYFSVIHLKVDAGFSITASHNPSQFNGIKLVRKNAFSVSYESGISQIEESVLKKTIFKNASKKGSVIKKDVLKDYITHEYQTANVKTLSNLKIVIDNGNGMSSIMLPSLLEKSTCKVIPMYYELDGTFPNHEANPLKEDTLKDLQKRVLKEKADIGIAFDGDGDRIGFVDEKGEIVRADIITALVGSFLSKNRKGYKVLYDLRSTHIVRETIIQNQGIPIESRVGHSFIKKQMNAEKIDFAGELSGHYYYFEDGHVRETPIATMLIVLNLVQKNKFSDLVKPLKKYVQSGEINFNVKNKDETIKKIEEFFKKENPQKIYYLDGLTMEFEDYWFNLRSSNTESLIRLNVESTNKKSLEQVISKINKMVKK